MSVVPQKTERRETRTLVLVIAINVAIILIIGIAVGVWFFSEEWTYYTVGDYDLDDGRFIKILGEKSSLSNTTNLRYEVTAGNKVLLSRNAEGARFYSSSDRGANKEARGFSIVPADQGDLIAITDRMRFDDIVILHDFRTNQSWPAHGKDQAAGAALGRAMLARLQREYPFFSCSALSSYRPRWVWSPKLTQWLVTYPDVSAGSPAGTPPRLSIRVFNTRNRMSSYLKTELATDEFNDSAAIGWMGNERVILALSPDRIFVWKLDAEGSLAPAVETVDQSVKDRAAELLKSPRQKELFAIPAPLLMIPEEDLPVIDEKASSPARSPDANSKAP